MTTVYMCHKPTLVVVVVHVLTVWMQLLQLNNVSMPLYTLAVLDQHGVGRPVVQALMYREDQSHIEMFLACAKEWAGPDAFRTTVFMVDKAQAEISALKALFTDNTILLCRFHVAKAFVQQIKKSNITSDEQEQLYKVLINDITDNVHQSVKDITSR